MPSGYDAEVAELFRDLRAATALSEMDLAARIGTRPEVVQALEQGALQALPPWAETCRVVNAYGTMLNLDVRPLLRRIYAQLEAGIVELQPKPMPDVPMMTPPRDADDFGFASGKAARRRAPNPLDIPWPPPACRKRQQPQPPHSPGRTRGRARAAPQARRPNAGRQPQPQTCRGPRRAATLASLIRAAAARRRRRGPGARPAAGPAARPRRTLSRARRRRRSRAQPQPQPPAPAAAAAPVQAPPQPEPMPVDADFGVPGRRCQRRPSRKPKRGRPALLKWALGALIVAVVASACGSRSVHAPGTSGLQSAGSGTADPDDPRSRKTDRLPDASASAARPVID